jgi:hypothetical protein
MKTLRIHRNGGTKTRSVQPQISHANKPDDKCASSAHSQTLPVKKLPRIIVNDENGRVFADLDIPPAILDFIAKAAPGNFERWILSANTHKMAASMPTKPDPVSLFNELDEAKAASLAINTLLHDALQRDNRSSYGEEINLGISVLISQTSRRLDQICASVQELMLENREVAS